MGRLCRGLPKGFFAHSRRCEHRDAETGCLARQPEGGSRLRVGRATAESRVQLSRIWRERPARGGFHPAPASVITGAARGAIGASPACSRHRGGAPTSPLASGKHPEIGVHRIVRRAPSSAQASFLAGGAPAGESTFRRDHRAEPDRGIAPALGTVQRHHPRVVGAVLRRIRRRARRRKRASPAATSWSA